MSKDLMKSITKKAKKASFELGMLSESHKNSVLMKMSDKIRGSRDILKRANQKDIEHALASGKDAAFVDRLTLTDKRIDGMCSMLEEVAGIKDPIGAVLEKNVRPNGLVIEKVRVPIGVIGIIYESRPNVTAECTALCLKSGNAVILRGGSDAIETNKAIYRALKEAAESEGLPAGAFIMVEDTSRKLVDELLGAAEDVDLIMPRGGESLIKQVVEKSKVPVIKHYKGICHVYVDSDANMEMAENICYNAKVQRPGVCNAMETMLVNENIADKFLNSVIIKFINAGVTVKGCSRTKDILEGYDIKDVHEQDFLTEYLNLTLNIRIVDSVEDAVQHINTYGSKHSDAIVTGNKEHAEFFLNRVDSSAVYVNASTRFTDGGEFGKGAEIGISTDKIHARGPMGLEELTSYKYVIRGNGQIRT